MGWVRTRAAPNQAVLDAITCDPKATAVSQPTSYSQVPPEPSWGWSASYMRPCHPIPPVVKTGWAASASQTRSPPKVGWGAARVPGTLTGQPPSACFVSLVVPVTALHATLPWSPSRPTCRLGEPRWPSCLVKVTSPLLSSNQTGPTTASLARCDLSGLDVGSISTEANVYINCDFARIGTKKIVKTMSKSQNQMVEMVENSRKW